MYNQAISIFSENGFGTKGKIVEISRFRDLQPYKMDHCLPQVVPQENSVPKYISIPLLLLKLFP